MEVQQREAAALSSDESELKRMIEECKGKIGRAERVKEMNRGFYKNEVESFKGISRFSSKLMAENLQCLKDISGWDIVHVNGTNVKMVFHGDMTVSFDIDNLARGIKVDIQENSDPIQQFIYSAHADLKGDTRTVPPSY